MVSGTEWTEPGQGATIGKLLARVLEDVRLAKWETFDKIQEGFRRDGWINFHRVTNLHLTGEPLTAEDVARIAEAR